MTEEITEPEKMTTLSAEQEYFSKHNHIEIFRLLHKLKEPCREVMYLRLSAELSFREIGEIMGKSENWARVTFYRGKETIRHQMEEGSRDDGEEANRRQRRK